MLGMILIIASACVFNNFIDRDIDTLMARTKNRALAMRAIPARAALVFALILGFFGFAFLYIYVNTLTALVALIGFIFYVFVYTFSKRKTSWGTVLGSVSGAMPIVAGYTAVADKLDAQALILFLILAIWQMPHFYAIAIYRIEDYRAAGIPVLPIVNGIKRTKVEMILYIIAFLIASCALGAFGYAGSFYFILMFAISLAWLVLALQGFRNPNENQWARQVFFFSLIVLMLFSVILALAPLFP
jgi:protoheme IX farnesyltransferase